MEKGEVSRPISDLLPESALGSLPSVALSSVQVEDNYNSEVAPRQGKIMQDIDLFQLALGLNSPWFVSRCQLDAQQKLLDIHIDFTKGGHFPCPQCARPECKAYDTKEETWRHLNFFQHETHLHARTPRVECPNCGIKKVAVPWSRPGCDFTLLFEAFVMTLVKQMPVNAVARLVGEHDTKLWRVVHHYVDQARDKQDFSEVNAVGVDETSSKRGHNYISVFVDIAESQVLFATEGKDAATLEAFKNDFETHNGSADQIEEMCCDMSPAFINGIQTHFPDAEITFDKFHVTKLLNKAVDEVRRQEQRSCPELKRTRYLWLKNPGNLNQQQQADLAKLQVPKMNFKTARAYQIKLSFQEVYKQEGSKGEYFLKKWYYWATHSRLEPIIEAARTIKRHWDGVLRWFESRITNGILEGINSLIQAAKAKARGYRTTKNLIAMVYLVAGKLNFELPT